ncbi:SMI1/KNR4 family protein [Nocardia cyriacigeorgica]|uniref:SMI1/KNR4 family protein n=1 Tax=Nocardia cyriacigeorgica TaxID=135487 RepID=UPI0013D56E7B|nr:SMI1/KNR4 family protein [Nocardia cyriacigeorgica]NEW29208.1 SMI1/KNR4 family protein [Nocardia cyriacigeorgica]
MRPLLTRLDRWLMLNRPAYRAGLRPGASADAIDALAARFEGRFPPLLRELLGWHDGEGADHRGALLGTWSLMSTDSIESTLADMAWLVDNDDMAEWWGPDWIPFLDNGWGDCVCVDLAGAFDGVAGQIVEFSHDSEYRSITHPGLEAWLFTIVRGFEDGIFALDCHAGVDRWDPVDDAAYRAFISEHYPGYPVTVRVGDDEPEPELDSGPASHVPPLPALDLDRIRGNLRAAGLGDVVVDTAFDLLPRTDTGRRPPSS